MPIPAMTTTPQVLISLSSFGAAEVRRHGQLWFTRLCKEAGADGVEIRGELLIDAASELPAIAAAVKELELQVVYSSPEPLWRDDGALDLDALGRAIDAAHVLGADRLKMSIGAFASRSRASLSNLKARLQQGAIELVIENDQTPSAGTIGALAAFFSDVDAAGFSLGMTFDMGNWNWAGECPLQAAQSFARRVCYVHCKGVQRQPQRWVAVPLAESAAAWRSILRALPANVPWAIEYPLAGDDLCAVTRGEIRHLRSVAALMAT